MQILDDLGAAVARTDLVIEAVPEDLGLKGRVFRELDAETDGIPLLTNTSSFSVASVANAVDDVTRVAGAHFFNPVQIMTLVEIIQTPQTDERVVSPAEDLMEDIGKTPIIIDHMLKEYGFVVNRI